MIICRPAGEEDRCILAGMLAEIAGEGAWISVNPMTPADDIASGWMIEDTMVAAAGEVITGMVTVVPSFEGHGELTLMVRAGWHGQGIGGALIGAAIERARSLGLHKLTLSVVPRNHGAISLYLRHGFTIEGYRVRHVRRPYGEFWDVIDMGLQLDTPHYRVISSGEERLVHTEEVRGSRP